MSERGRSTSPRLPQNSTTDVDMDKGKENDLLDAKVVIINNLTRNVVESHLRTVFGFYGQIVKLDLPLFTKCECHYLLFILERFSHLPHISSRSKSRKSRPRILPIFGSTYCCFSYEWRTARRSYPKSRALRSPRPFSFSSFPFIPVTFAETSPSSQRS